MPPVIEYTKLIKVLKKLGFSRVRTKGSHERWKNDLNQKLTVPYHKEIAYGTFLSLCEQGKLNPKDIIQNMS